MKKISVVWSCFVMTFFVACQQAEVENLKADDLRMSISASINGQKESLDSRYAGSDPNDVDFETDDAIGLFIENTSAIEWVYGEDGWTSGDNIVYWPDKENPLTFRAFYPYVEASTYADVSMPSLLNQTGTIESISECDFLVASTTQTYVAGGVVSFENEHSFYHVSTLLKLTFNGGGDLAGSVLTRIKIEGNGVVASSTYSFVDDGNVSLDLKEDDSDDVLIVSLANEDGNATIGNDAKTFYLIVNERTKNELSTVTLTIEYEKDEVSYTASLDNFVNNGFVGGACQSYIFTIKDGSLVITGSEIAPWSGGESLDDIEINGEVKQETT